MPVRYVIDKQRQVVLSTASDRVTFAEFKAHQEQLMNDPDFRPGFNQIIDGTNATALDISTGELRALTASRIFSAASKRAFVAAEPAVYGIARMAEVYLEMAISDSQTRVFQDLPTALKWLGLDGADWPKT